ncbi:hypothetical protein BD560DRAFT_314320, partial [Blakeslea trispora]
KQTVNFKTLLFSNDEESVRSNERKGNHGRKPDDGLRVVFKEHQQHIMHMKIKSQSVVLEDQVHHVGFAKLTNLMK